MRKTTAIAGTLTAAMALSTCVSPAAAWEMTGKKSLIAHTSDGKDVRIGSVTFTPDGDKTKFAVDMDYGVMKEFFLSMTKFRCLAGKEIFCFVPYPYQNPRTVTAKDLVWLDHALLFFWKTPNDYGAKLGNGLYYDMKTTDNGLVGKPQAIGLDKIASPPDDPSKPPFGPAGERDEIQPGERWIDSLKIE